MVAASATITTRDYGEAGQEYPGGILGTCFLSGRGLRASGAAKKRPFGQGRAQRSGVIAAGLVDPPSVEHTAPPRVAPMWNPWRG